MEIGEHEEVPKELEHLCPVCNHPFSRRKNKACPRCKTALYYAGEYMFDQSGYMFYPGRGWVKVEDLVNEVKSQMPDYEYQDFMEFTGITNQHLGRLYTCPRCKKRYWSAWGHARRHFEKERKKHFEEVMAIIKKSEEKDDKR